MIRQATRGVVSIRTEKLSNKHAVSRVKALDSVKHLASGSTEHPVRGSVAALTARSFR